MIHLSTISGMIFPLRRYLNHWGILHFFFRWRGYSTPKFQTTNSRHQKWGRLQVSQVSCANACSPLGIFDYSQSCMNHARNVLSWKVDDNLRFDLLPTLLPSQLSAQRAMSCFLICDSWFNPKRKCACMR